MIPIKVPDWWDSIRAIIALALTINLCVATYFPEISDARIAALEKLTMLALTFYFVLKRRPKENGGVQQ